MINLENGEVNVGDNVIIKNGSVVGKFESMYDGKMNVRVLKTNDLVTTKIKDVKKAETAEIEKLGQKDEKASLLKQFEELKVKLAKFEVFIGIVEGDATNMRVATANAEVKKEEDKAKLVEVKPNQTDINKAAEEAKKAEEARLAKIEADKKAAEEAKK